MHRACSWCILEPGTPISTPLCSLVYTVRNLAPLQQNVDVKVLAGEIHSEFSVPIGRSQDSCLALHAVASTRLATETALGRKVISAVQYELTGETGHDALCVVR